MSIKNLNPGKSKYLSGDFSKYQPKKYFGEFPIWYRSSYELKFMRILELNTNVERWSSENIVVPYTMQERNKQGKYVTVKHKYNTDFTVILKDGTKYLIEVKPKTLSPTDRSQIFRSMAMYKNARKWKAALEWSKLNGFIFKVITEENLKTKIF